MRHLYVNDEHAGKRYVNKVSGEWDTKSRFLNRLGFIESLYRWTVNRYYPGIICSIRVFSLIPCLLHTSPPLPHSLLQGSVKNQRVLHKSFIDCNDQTLQTGNVMLNLLLFHWIVKVWYFKGTTYSLMLNVMTLCCWQLHQMPRVHFIRIIHTCKVKTLKNKNKTEIPQDVRWRQPHGGF